ncbi:MAG: alkaline phosphatase D family protein [Gemmatimonadaceae bacterium]|nr:alkaline phosphatase D family protein [Gemmatimonadaceae bacterium]
MRRRDLLKRMAMAGALWQVTHARRTLGQPRPQRTSFRSDWHDWPDMRWIGPMYWANRLQDWRLSDGHAECWVAGRNRTVHCLTTRRTATSGNFTTHVVVQRLERGDARPTDCLGLRLGAKGPRDDYRSAAVYGTGLDLGVTGDGRLRIGARVGTDRIDPFARVRLRVNVTSNILTLTAEDPTNNAVLASLVEAAVAPQLLVGSVALLCHVDVPEVVATDATVAVRVARFAEWEIHGDGLLHDASAEFGPVCFAQYTLHGGTLKLTAQLAPIEVVAGHSVRVDVREAGRWRNVATPAIDPLSRTAQVRVDKWRATRDIPYRVRVMLPVAGALREYRYEGTIAREPLHRTQLRVACFSCNADHGFPDADVIAHVRPHRADMAVFLGDQFYESHGGFGVQRAPLDDASLDMLRKWYMFGWSYRELFRHIPSACIPDDHDVYHGNIWGESGAVAPTQNGWGYPAQDEGGYKMPAPWVNVVQRAQTSHLPDPYDPTPVSQGIGVYYTRWQYAGVDFAILEDRKFKSAPKHILPASAKVVNGFATDVNFDHRAHREHPTAQLLGARQEAFLAAWAADRTPSSVFKVVLSQTPFCAAHTLPIGSTSDEAVPTLPIPQPGTYVTGDAPVGDMDTNGWPQNKRDDALRLLRSAGAFHIAGDQHLATVIRYGIDAHRDAGYVFTVPALNNLWPRRWWPTLAPDHVPLQGRARYTGDFLDAFGNRLTMVAAANPRQSGIAPAIIHDRVTGYGIVVFDKTRRTIRMECWPRHVDSVRQPNAQFAGWPITIQHPTVPQ